MRSIMAIDHTDLARIDLNLLVALDALLLEQSVTRAATKIGIGQSAMSSALARLRRLFGDELLTRAPEGMRMTPRALALAPQVRDALRRIQSLIRHDESFDPKAVKRVFTIAVPDSIEVLLIPRILAYLRAEAPGISLTLRAFDRVTIQADLDADQLDLGIGFLLEGQVHHKQRLLFRDNFVCLFNAGLLGIEAPISMEDYLRFPHVLTSVSGVSRGIVDEALAKEGLSRTLILLTPRFLAVPFLVQNAPVMTTMAAKLATLFSKTLGLAVSPAPVVLEDMTTSMIWHASYDDDPAHKWLRDLVTRESRAV